MKVKEILQYAKANCKTYYNLDKKQKDYFKQLYLYTKKHKEDLICPLYVDIINKYINKFSLSYIEKIRLMEIAIH